MNINNKESFSERYAVISYSHEDADVVKAEMVRFDDRNICYWFDKDMIGGKSYVKEFCEKLDNENCGGCIFFISESFLLSQNCAAEVNYFYDKYGNDNPDKFCFLVIPEHLSISGAGTREEKIEKITAIVKNYVLEKPIPGVSDEDLFIQIKNNIELFLKLSHDFTSLYGLLGDKNDYIRKYSEEGQTFYNAAIIYGHKQTKEISFGFFPQDEIEDERYNYSGIDEEKIIYRRLDKKQVYYAPVEWLLVSDTILLSKKLLFAIDYLNLKYPIVQSDETVAMYIEKEFKKYFRDSKKHENEVYKIKKIRFLKEDELKIMLLHAKNDRGDPFMKKREILLPEPTFFAQITNRKDSHAFWLAGNMEDARRVDVATKSLSEQKAGVELYYVRIVLEVEKQND